MLKTINEYDEKRFAIVGIGASAGGLEAATQLLKALPVNLGMGFVLVQHLDPIHESILADLLSKTTAMPVDEAKDNIRVLPNHVYVIPHDKDMTISEGILKLTTRIKDKQLHMPIDQFFRSLALSQKEKAIGVILSGTASDGTHGLKAIKSEGGITFAQDETAKYQGMPKAAIASGYVDFILSPQGIAEELSGLSSHPFNRQPAALKDEHELSEDGLTKIFFLLQRSCGIDFRHYKRATIDRRIRRRMLLHKLTSVKDYLEFLKKNSSEIESLSDDLLINVTSFYREPQLFQNLNNTIFPRLIKNRSPKEPIRIWVPGCATGEEVYSVAISLSEFLTKSSANIPVQIFGTDIRNSSIEKARSGKYSQNEVAEISQGRLARFFEKTNGGYQVSKFIREMCIFAKHNVFSDPPFSRLDLVSCCNLLIYLDPVLQDKILRAFHFGLKPEGFLVLGKSESVSTSPELFSQIEKNYKIYTKKDRSTRETDNIGNFISTPDTQDANKADVKSEDIIDTLDMQKEADKILLSRYTPASVIINNDLEIRQFRGSTGAYLEPSPGKASFNLIKMARVGLGFELRNAVSKVKKNGKPFRKENISINTNGNTQNVTIEVLPLKFASPEAHFLILFEDSGQASQTEIMPKIAPPVRGAKDRRIAQLEQELSQTREDMRSVTEEQEATNEELKTASEEILSSNEELQSINEELETSKEELESTNEELTTLNEELQNRNELIVQERNYAEAIIRTVQVPLIILNRDLRVKTANRSFYRMFQVNEEETKDKFIYDLGNGQWNIPVLRELLSNILPKNNVFDNYEIEHTFPSIGHKIMLLNARRFFKDGDNILLAIEDITDRRDIEEQKNLFIGIASHELKTPVTTLKAFAQILGKRLSKQGDPENDKLIGKITKQSDRLTRLIEDLLNTSKIQAGNLILEKKKLDLNKLVAKVVSDSQFTDETHKIITEGIVEESVFADQNRIEQVLINLITNAIKYSPGADKINVRLCDDKKNAYISVQDFGIGIPKKDQGKIFRRFFRTSEKKTMNIAGFGLGLFIAAEIVKAHQGKIWVESHKGKGSTFFISLPINQYTA